MPYAFDYAVASSYGASFAAREEESGKGTVGQFQLDQADQSKQVTYSVSGGSGFKANTKWSIKG